MVDDIEGILNESSLRGFFERTKDQMTDALHYYLNGYEIFVGTTPILDSIRIFIYETLKLAPDIAKFMTTFDAPPEVKGAIIQHLVDEYYKYARAELLRRGDIAELPPPKQSTVSTVAATVTQPSIVFKHIADTDKDAVRFCLVQLDYSLRPKPGLGEFGFVLEDEDKTKEKVFGALDTAHRNKVNVVCFPELSFSKSWVEEIKKKHREMVIIGGSYYDGGYNVSPIIVDGDLIEPSYRKHKPSSSENPQTTGYGMKSGDTIYVLQTRYGRFSVLTCIDYADQSQNVCRHLFEDQKKLDFIINVCHDENIYRFQERCNSDCEDYDVDVIQVNRSTKDEKYGRTCIIGKEHNTILDKLKDQGFKPDDRIRYKLFELIGEMMIIVDMNMKMKAPPVNPPIDYAGRITIRKERCYVFNKGHWVPMTHG